MRPAVWLAVALLIAPVVASVAPAADGAATTLYKPGMRTYSNTGQCTANFVFADEADLYVGTAAHCVSSDPIGSWVGFQSGAYAQLVYSSWRAGAGSGPDAHDFALMKVPRSAHANVDPALPGFGTPTGVAASQEVAYGEKVVSYGNSGLRGGLANAKEGYIVGDPFYEYRRSAWFATPGIPGDSGSAVVLGDGQAFGVLVTVSALAGFNGMTVLDKSLAYMAAHGGPEVEVVTGAWDPSAQLTPDVV